MERPSNSQVIAPNNYLKTEADVGQYEAPNVPSGNMNGKGWARRKYTNETQDTKNVIDKAWSMISGSNLGAPSEHKRRPTPLNNIEPKINSNAKSPKDPNFGVED